MNKTNLLSKVCKKCYEISINSKADVFFSYAPHCNSYEVSYYLEGWKQDNNPTYINSVTSIAIENLNKTLEELEKIFGGK